MQLIEVYTVPNEAGLAFDKEIMMEDIIEVTRACSRRETYSAAKTDRPYDITPPQLTDTDRWLLYPDPRALKIKQKVTRRNSNSLLEEERGFEFEIRKDELTPFFIISAGSSNKFAIYGLVQYRRGDEDNKDMSPAPSPSTGNQLVLA